MKKSFSLAEKITTLEKIEAYFQLPDFDLEEAIKKHAEAQAIATEILDYLQKAESSFQEVSLPKFNEEKIAES